MRSPVTHGLRRGLTLVEILVVLTLIGVMASVVAVVAVQRHRDHASVTQLKADLATYASYQETYADLNDTYASSPSQLVGFAWSDATDVVSSAGSQLSWSITARSPRTKKTCAMSGGPGAGSPNPVCP